MKKTNLKKIPILIQLYPEDVHKADLAKALRIDRHRINRELLKQPETYGFWASLYAKVTEKVAFIEEQKDDMEAKLFKHYRIDRKITKVTDIKFYINNDDRYKLIKSRLRRWKDAERVLKYAEKAFQQRLNVLMAFNANRRADKRAENFKEEEDD